MGKYRAEAPNDPFSGYNSVVEENHNPGELILYTIYKYPTDLPYPFVVRRFRISGGKPEAEAEPWCVALDLDNARTSIPISADNLGRDRRDEKNIVETWVNVEVIGS